ncbi:MAG: DNA-3-methyladenine glycosylase [Anaerolineaceae bacterium]|jgi:DNA-3-methyladenine glycosylase|nr:DNA-3-methyladenine glycosylase [Anaerolineaceae bacterium]MDD4042716.1 DNA-3-methyladenine glycosylase [Anaerolineaceae bacterium]MDD4577075.1 DNA-3-methyladenine glycosylase [Anaerolineaceae bacterium]
MLKIDFYERPAPLLAPDLIGKKLVRLQNGTRLAGIIIETEAYQGQEDLACHAHFGRTKRNQVMYEEPGRAYVYFTYGMHWLLNIVADRFGHPAAVLIRAIFPVEGQELMALNRPNLANSHQWLNGPAKLTQALALNGSMNGYDLTKPGAELFLEEGTAVPAELVNIGPRIGLGKTPEPWLSIPWRWELDWQQAQNLIQKGVK